MSGLMPEITLEYPPGPPPRSSSVWLQKIQQIYGKAKRLIERFVDSAFWHKTVQAYQAALSAFTTHPAQTNESYAQHLWFTVKTSLRILATAALLFLHGVFPFLFTRTASRQIESLYLMMRSRIPKTRRDILEGQYDI